MTKRIAINGFGRIGRLTFRRLYNMPGVRITAINEGKINFFDMHLSTVAQNARYGFFGEVDVAIIEACDAMLRPMSQRTQLLARLL